MEELAASLTSAHCGTDLVVHIELDRFTAALPALHRAVFVEPVVLYGSREWESYMRAKAALAGVPHTVLRMPTNSSGGVRLHVIDDL